jgi:hypothetical protein
MERRRQRDADSATSRLRLPAAPDPSSPPLAPGQLECPSGGNPRLVLAYDPWYHTDGAGAQLVRQVGLYQLSFPLGLGYAHVPIKTLSNLGIQATQAGGGEPGLAADLSARWAATFDLPSHHTWGCSGDVDATVDAVPCRHEWAGWLSWPALREHARVWCAAASASTTANTAANVPLGPMPAPVVLHISYVHQLLNQQPALIMDDRSLLGRALPWLRHAWARERQEQADWQARAQGDRPPPPPLRVAVHVRRGDVLVDVGRARRLLPNSYFVDVCLALRQVFIELGILSFEFEVYTERLLAPMAGRAKGANGEPIVVRPEDDTLDEFAALSASPATVRMFVNTDAVDAVRAMSTAAVLVTSHSAFSIVAALLHDPPSRSRSRRGRSGGLVVYHPFSHKPRPDWFVMRDAWTPEQRHAALLIAARRSLLPSYDGYRGD